MCIIISEKCLAGRGLLAHLEDPRDNINLYKSRSLSPMIVYPLSLYTYLHRGVDLSKNCKR